MIFFQDKLVQFKALITWCKNTSMHFYFTWYPSIAIQKPRSCKTAISMHMEGAAFTKANYNWSTVITQGHYFFCFSVSLLRLIWYDFFLKIYVVVWAWPRLGGAVVINECSQFYWCGRKAPKHRDVNIDRELYSD